MRKKPVIWYVSNLLILLSIVGFGIIAFPIVRAYLPQPELSVAIKEAQFSVWVPQIKAAGVIHPNIDPWDELAYKQALKTGIGHAKGTALPDQPGTVFLFAHSSGLPWELTQYNSVFLRLGELENGDTIEVRYKGKLYTYEVINKKEVQPTEVKYLQEKNNNQLILQTCTPIGTDWRRLLVFAKLVTE